ncbi:hypothetical protein EC973_004019 [Apophysomyces ossiformis]|uniref:Methyltransferase type 11 domain-containing protein n=1 Tax=Apophysomyces ossiformis TaxID=679940 RepID=A0A8H7ETD4_9FUNG|nr:hypothetical protein EC973_004019 [Apophysomyces ossiformis]
MELAHKARANSGNHLDFSTAHWIDHLRSLSQSLRGNDGGRWCVEMGLFHPQWDILGIKYPDQKQPKRTPPNVHYIDYPDLLWVLSSLPSNTFDLVFVRFLALDRGDIMEQCWRVCRPQGFVELTELDLTIYGTHIGPLTENFNTQVKEVISLRSRDPALAQHLQDCILCFSPQMYTTHYTSLPLGKWAGRLGIMARDNIHRVIESFQPAIERLKKEHKTEQDLETELNIMDDEFEQNHAFVNVHYMSAQKP